MKSFFVNFTAVDKQTEIFQYLIGWSEENQTDLSENSWIWSSWWQFGVSLHYATQQNWLNIWTFNNRKGVERFFKSHR